MCTSDPESMSSFWYDLDSKSAGLKFEKNVKKMTKNKMFFYVLLRVIENFEKNKFLAFWNVFLLIFAVFESMTHYEYKYMYDSACGSLRLELPPGN